jgi:hypothetical protein
MTVRQFHSTSCLSIQVVRIDFVTFDTERRYDKVWFFDGNTTLSKVIQGIGGTYETAPTAIISSQQFLFVWFTSDSATNAVGFSAEYTSTSPSMYIGHIGENVLLLKYCL